MCGCTKKTTTRSITSNTRSLDTNRSLQMAKVATEKILENLHNEFPNEFVLANYNNGLNFRYAKSTNGKLFPYGYTYYGIFSGIKQIYVHKDDVNGTNITIVEVPKVRNIEPAPEPEKPVEVIEPIESEPIESNIEVETDTEIINDDTEEKKPRKRRSKKSENADIETVEE